LVVGEGIRFLIRRKATSSEPTGMNTLFCNFVPRDVKLTSIVVRLSIRSQFQIVVVLVL
jgi:hypothetical protein